MVVRIINWLRGYVSLLLSGQFIERFINICMHRGIFLWDVRKTGAHTAHAKMSVRAFKLLPPIARKTHTRVKIIKKHGLPIRLAAYRQRIFFMLGLLLAVSFLYGSSLFLWSVQIEGCDSAQAEAQISRVLSELGVRKGAYKRALNVADIKNSALARLDKELSWLWVDIRGCRATVRVQQKSAPPKILSTDPCDIVAATNGVIVEVQATEGHKVAAVGDTVVQGQLLISSVIPSERIAARYTHAAGKVYARTWYEESITVPLSETKKEYTGNAHTHRALQIGTFTLPLSDQKNIPYRLSERKRTLHELVLFGHHTSLIYRTDEYAEYTTREVEIPTETAIADAEKKLDASIRKACIDPDAVLLSAHSSTVKNPDGTLTVTRTAEFKEQIGLEKAVNAL